MTDKSAQELIFEMKAIFDNFDKATETGKERARKASLVEILGDCSNALTDAGVYPELVEQLDMAIQQLTE